jgi:hypothetical protein
MPKIDPFEDFFKPSIKPVNNFKVRVYDFNELLIKKINKPLHSTELMSVVTALNRIDIKISTNGPWIAGGSLLLTYLDKPLDSDVDIYFKNLDQYKESSIKLERYFHRLYKTEFSDTFLVYALVNNRSKEIKIQLVYYNPKPTATEIISEFDLDVCQIAFDGSRVVTSTTFVESVNNMKMNINIDKISKPIFTLKRLMKYSRRGFSIDDDNLNRFLSECVGVVIDKKEKNY